jgi:hypothetical protein
LRTGRLHSTPADTRDQPLLQILDLLERFLEDQAIQFVQFIGIDAVGNGVAAVDLLLQPETLDVMKGVDQRRQFERRHAGPLTADAQPLDGIGIRYLPGQRIDPRRVDEGP